jgi:hypothetical protein
MTRIVDITLTDRGFGQDAINAIGGDPVRALIELITNADDAYERASTNGDIQIVVGAVHQDYPAAISVFDSARGMTEAELEDRLTNLGALNQDFLEGKSVRGNLGRGAKDCVAFGAVWFRTIRNNEYSELLIRIDKSAEIEEQRPATAKDREALRLGPNQNGLCASMMFTDATKRRIPGTGDLVHRLANEAQLRDINRNRNVYFETKTPKVHSEKLEPLNPAVIESIEVFRSNVPGYEDSEFELHLEILAERQNAKFDQSSPHGILIKGDKSTFENTLFGLQGQPESRWMRGVLKCSAIEELIKQFDLAGSTRSNDSRILRRDRSGLDREHPFTKALVARVMPKIQGALKSIAEKFDSGQSEGEVLNQRLRTLSRAIRIEMKQLLEELEGPAGSGHTTSFRAIPPKLVVELDQVFFVSVVSPSPNEDREPSIKPSSGISLTRPDIAWRERSNTADSICSFRFRADRLGNHQIEFDLDGENAYVSVEVVSSRETPLPDYSKLHFERTDYQVKRGGNRNVKIYAPLSVGSINLRTDEGLSAPSGVNLEPSEDGCGQVGYFKVTAGRDLKDVTLRAEDISGDNYCEATFSISELEGSGLPEFDFQVTNEELGDRRSGTVPGMPVRVVVYGKHPANMAALGRFNDETRKFPNEESAPALRMLAELYSNELARFIVERNAELHPDDFADASQVMVKHSEYSSRLISYCLSSLEQGAR